MRSHTRNALLASACALLGAAPVAAQLPATVLVRETMASRTELKAIADQPDFVPGQLNTDEATRTHRRYEASLARQRLTDGDFSAGDRVILSVGGEEALTDTFTVRAGRKL